jgi:hypothetical protein
LNFFCQLLNLSWRPLEVSNQTDFDPFGHKHEDSRPETTGWIVTVDLSTACRQFISRLPLAHWVNAGDASGDRI